MKLTNNCFMDPDKIMIKINYDLDQQRSQYTAKKASDINLHLQSGSAYDVYIELPVVSHKVIRLACGKSKIDPAEQVYSGSTAASKNRLGTGKKKKRRGKR